MPDKVEIAPVGPLNCEVRPPGSKSITNRALVCAALADGNSLLTGVLESEDTEVMIDSLQKLGVNLQVDWGSNSIEVAGCGGAIPAQSANLFIANSGTSVRFLTSMVALGRGRFRLDGIERMRERPIGDLLTALQQLGIDATSEAGTGCPPVVVNATGMSDGKIDVRGDISSQYLSGLLMAAGSSKSQIKIEVDGVLVSKPYVRMTLAVMKSFGHETTVSGDLAGFDNQGGQGYVPAKYAIEPDASAASYFWGAAAITGGRVKVDGLSRDALQGDVRFCECLEQMGCQIEYQEDSITVVGTADLKGIDVDMNDISDTVQTLSAVALFAKGPTRVRGVAHNRHKETDRIADLARELRKLGAVVTEHPDGLEINPGELRGCAIETYNDHRMAMSMAIVGLRLSSVEILNPGCTAKTYPRFFEDLAGLS